MHIQQKVPFLSIKTREAALPLTGKDSFLHFYKEFTKELFSSSHNGTKGDTTDDSFPIMCPFMRALVLYLFRRCRFRLFCHCSHKIPLSRIVIKLKESKKSGTGHFLSHSEYSHVLRSHQSALSAGYCLIVNSFQLAIASSLEALPLK